ncbi:MAG: cation-translocating P-type ATPase, partial [Halanaerobiales bacterium]
MKENPEYYCLKKEEVIKEVDVDPEKGLNDKEVKRRLEKYGDNKLRKSKKVSIQEVLLRQLKDLMMILLLITGIVAFVIGEVVEAFAILAIVIFNTSLGFVTEYKAEKSMDSLKSYLTPVAKVRRSGSIHEIDAAQLLPGDILLIEEGDRVSADGRLLESSNLSVDESILTGESETVEKDAEFKTDQELPLAERSNMVYMGTTVTRGSATVLVTATSSNTEMGQIGSLLEDTDEDKTPLQERLDQLGKHLVKLTLVVTFIIIIVAGLMGKPWLETIKTAIALAIAAVPEGLPIVATVTLAIGMRRMAENNALIRRLLAVETLGSTTSICTDKTGTITENQMTLQKIYLNDETIEVSGTGYKPEGDFTINDQEINTDENESLELFLKAATLCSNATLSKNEDDQWNVIGDPTEGALVAGARKAGYDREEMEDENYQRLAELSFSSERMYMAVSYHDSDKNNYIFMKGSPSVVLDKCDSIYLDGEHKELNKDSLKKLKNINKTMAQGGLRLLALAYQSGVKAENEDEIKNCLNSGIVFLGYAGIIDPPREGVKEAIATAQNAGVKIKLITGDQSDTALSIAKEIGIVEDNEKTKSISGQEISSMSSKELKEAIKNSSVFYRVSPENKLEIIDALNDSDEVTAMTGDGVNDAPALKKADIGVSMGQRGTSVARESSDMVLLNDSFDSIVKAIKEG